MEDRYHQANAKVATMTGTTTTSMIAVELMRRSRCAEAIGPCGSNTPADLQEARRMAAPGTDQRSRREQRKWLGGRAALLIETAHGRPALEHPLRSASVVAAGYVFYPGLADLDHRPGKTRSVNLGSTPEIKCCQFVCFSKPLTILVWSSFVNCVRSSCGASLCELATASPRSSISDDSRHRSKLPGTTAHWMTQPVYAVPVWCIFFRLKSPLLHSRMLWNVT